MPKCQHGNAVCSSCVVVTDAGKRMSDTINMLLTFKTFDELKGGWIAFALADGTSDYVVYPSKAEAARHQPDEFRYMYFPFRNAMGGASPKDCQLLLDVYRHAYDNGFGQHEIEAPQLIMPLARGIGRWPM